MNSAINHDRVALVTGAGQRIGAQIARTLHGRGYRVLLHYRRADSPAVSIADELNQVRADSACALRGDLCSLEQVARLAADATARWHRLDALVNNASAWFPTTWGTASEADWDALFGSNLKGPFFLTQALLPALADQGGSVINLIDIFAERPARNFPLYCMAKAGLTMLTRSLAFDRGHQVRVNGIAPGVILWPEPSATAPSEGSREHDIPEELFGDELARERVLQRIPQRRSGEPGDIARTVLFLLDDAPYINGQIIAVDGGYSLNL